MADNDKTMNLPDNMNLPADAKPLSAARLNNVRFSTKHTVLTPETIAKLSRQNAAKPQS